MSLGSKAKVESHCRPRESGPSKWYDEGDPGIDEPDKARSSLCKVCNLVAVSGGDESEGIAANGLCSVWYDVRASGVGLEGPSRKDSASLKIEVREGLASVIVDPGSGLVQPIFS